jgi:triose/dihydroxyacetone kinase / FAD-AMP lyase (cyclizing)
MLVHKVTGAMAAAGYGLEDIVRVGRLVADNLGSIGVSLNRVHVPGRPREENGENSLGSDEVELGMGIHNETGCGRKSGANAELPVVIKDMLRQLLDSNDGDRNFLPTRANEMVLMVNNLGALSVLELGAVVSEVVEQLRQQYTTNLVRVFAGSFMTSLDGPGFSISLLNVVNIGIKESLIELLDAASNAIGWHATARSDGSTSKECDKRIKMRNSGEIEEQFLRGAVLSNDDLFCLLFHAGGSLTFYRSLS